MELYAFAEIARSKSFKGTLVFAATADEEMGGAKGAGWLVKNRQDLVRADYVINEGGGFEMPLARGSLFTVQTAEKGVYWFRLKFTGTSGHASIPGAYRNAVTQAAEAIARISRAKPKIHVTPHAARFIRTVSKLSGKSWAAWLLLNPVTADWALKAVRDPSQAAFIEAMLRNTLAPTIVRGGYRENVIPHECEVTVDCRLLPGYSEQWILDYLRGILGPTEYEVEFIKREPPSESPIGTPLFEAIAETVSEKTGSAVSPYISPGGTDSRYFRWAFGSVAYGFTPLRSDVPFSEMLRMVHGVNERISIENLEFGFEVLVETLLRFYSKL